jgi:radical SAM protein with 4Fe4S-binding SPASM domain
MQFIKDFSDISDEINIDDVMGWSNSDLFDFTLGRDPKYAMNGYTLLNKQRIVCPQPFYTLAINFNGLVSACCVDWTMRTIVGNCQTNRIDEIWRGELLKKFRLMQLNGCRSQSPVCSACQYVYGMTPFSDLDQCKNDLLLVYTDTETAEKNIDL